MSVKKHSTAGRRGGFLAIAVAVVGIVGGLSFIGIALASQESGAQPSVANEGSGSTLARVVTSDAWLNETLPAILPMPLMGPSSDSDVVGPTMARSKPVALDIPAIDVHSDLQDLGLESDGALEVPAGPHYDEAAWYRYSPTPGSLGPAVLLGHIDSATNGPSVFFRLGELKPGDEVSVTRADGSAAIFIVDKVHSYPKDDFPTELVYGDIDHAGLRILTCGGAFDDAAGHYLNNVVVFASLR